MSTRLGATFVLKREFCAAAVEKWTNHMQELLDMTLLDKGLR